MTTIILKTKDKIIYKCEAEAFYLTRMRSSWHGYAIVKFQYCEHERKFTVIARKIKELATKTPLNSPKGKL